MYKRQVLDYDNPPLEANDSKKLSPAKREALYEKIMAEAKYAGIGLCLSLIHI